MIALRLLNGTEVGKIISVSQTGPVRIGTGESNEIVLHEKGVSREHCELTSKEGNVEVRDLGSTNGVIVKSARTEIPEVELRLQKSRIEVGDLILLGAACLRVENQESVAAAEEELTEIVSSAQPSGGAVLLADIPEESRNFYSDLTGYFAPQTQSLPYTFRDYVVHEKIGQGGMGDVYLAARHESEATAVAIKFLRSSGSNPADQLRFVREMQIASDLRHPAIVESFESGDHAGRLFICMEYCAGGNLAELLKRSGTIKLGRAIRLLDRLLSGAEHAHASGIVHRDLKPANILLAKNDRGKYLPKISDFGLAKSYLLAGSSGMTTNGTVGGSWDYMPREQLTDFRFVTPQSDVWSMGAIFYECLTMHKPRLNAPGTEAFRNVLDGVVRPIVEIRPEIPSSISDFIMCSLATEPADRYQDAGAMRRELRRISDREGFRL